MQFTTRVNHIINRFALVPCLIRASSYSVNSASFLSNLTVVKALASLTIFFGFFSTIFHKACMSSPRPILLAVLMLLASTNGARQGQRCCAVSKKISTPTSPRPLIDLTSARILAGSRFVFFKILFKSPSKRRLEELSYRLVRSIDLPYLFSMVSASSPIVVAPVSLPYGQLLRSCHLTLL